MAGRTSIVLFKQYATYQACLDIYSNQITTEDVFKKTFLYIMDWLKGRIGKDTLEELPDLKKYPGVSGYKSFDTHDMHGFKLLSETDILISSLASQMEMSCLIICWRLTSLILLRMKRRRKSLMR